MTASRARIKQRSRGSHENDMTWLPREGLSGLHHESKGLGVLSLLMSEPSSRVLGQFPKLELAVARSIRFGWGRLADKRLDGRLEGAYGRTESANLRQLDSISPNASQPR